MIRNIGKLLNLNTNSNNISVLSETFDFYSKMLKTEVHLLKQTANTPKGKKNECSYWVNWFTESNFRIETIFCYVVKGLKTIVYTSYKLFLRTNIFQALYCENQITQYHDKGSLGLPAYYIH